MPTIDDIKAAIAGGDPDLAEELVVAVSAKRGVGGEDRQIFAHQIAQLRGGIPPAEVSHPSAPSQPVPPPPAEEAAEPEPEPEAAEEAEADEDDT